MPLESVLGGKTGSGVGGQGIGCSTSKETLSQQADDYVTHDPLSVAETGLLSLGQHCSPLSTTPLICALTPSHHPIEVRSGEFTLLVLQRWPLCVTTFWAASNPVWTAPEAYWRGKGINTDISNHRLWLSTPEVPRAPLKVKVSQLTLLLALASFLPSFLPSFTLWSCRRFMDTRCTHTQKKILPVLVACCCQV